MKKNYQDDEDGDASQDKLINSKEGINNTRNTQDGDAKARQKKIIKWSMIGGLITIIVILAIVLPIVLKKSNDDNPPEPIPPNPVIPPGYNPYIVNQDDVVDNQADISGYLRFNQQQSIELHQQKSAELRALAAQSSGLSVDQKQIPVGVNNQMTEVVKFAFDMIAFKVAHLSLTNNASDSYEIPKEAMNKPNPDATMRMDMVGFNLNVNPFYFNFTDNSDRTNWYVSTQDMTLLFEDKFIQMDILLPSQYVYGFGERIHDFRIQEGTWTMWATPLQDVDDGLGRKGTSGVHPFVLVRGKNKDDYFGIYFRQSTAMSPVLRYYEDKSILSFISLGGALDIYFFVHGSPKEMIQQYHNTIGSKFNLPPFWALGWHEASAYFKDTKSVTDIVQKYIDNNLPLDAIHLGSQALASTQDFKFDDKNFDLTQIRAALTQRNNKVVLAVSPSIIADTTQGTYYYQGKASAFIKSGIYQEKVGYSGNLLNIDAKGRLSVYYDLFGTDGVNLLVQGLNSLYSQTQYDGVTVDGNEPYASQPGEFEPSSLPKNIHESEEFSQAKYNNYAWYGTFPQNNESTFYLPFIPGYPNNPSGAWSNGNFDNLTISLNATHPSNKLSEYYLHNLYGHMMSKVVFTNNQGMDATKSNQRKFSLSRSTFPSSGMYTSHSLGENLRTWEHLKYSIAGVMSMNMFGIPHVGADVCGYSASQQDEELCARWYQLSTFYPFARYNQNDKLIGGQADPQHEPFLLSGLWGQMASASVKTRYNYLRHYYTCLFEVSQYGGTCVDPTFFFYPQDDNLHNDYQANFMVGNAILVTPVTQALDGAGTFKAYFPKGKWVDLGSGNFQAVGSWDQSSTVDLNANQAVVNHHLAPGTLIAWQDTVTAKANSTIDLLNLPISIVANRDENMNAQGTIFLDNGEKIDEITNNQYEYYQISLQSNSLQMSFGAGTKQSQAKNLDQLLITDASNLQSTTFACYLDQAFVPHKMDQVFIPEINSLRISPLAGENLQFSNFISIQWGGDKDVNLCEVNNYRYTPAAPLPDLSKAKGSVTFTLNHAILPSIDLTIRIIYDTIVNVKWSWTLVNGKLPSGVRQPFVVPDEYITTDNVPTSQKTLDQFVSISANPYFTLNVKYPSVDNPSTMLTLNGMLYDQYMNFIDVTVNTPSLDQFTGVFGLGQRANKNFFYTDGVYSMHTRDIPTPDEDGESPGKNMYGVHPFYMYKHKTGVFTGVLYKLANSMDYFIKNNQALGQVQLQTVANGGVADIYVWQGAQPDSVVSTYFKLVGNPVLVPQWALGWNQCRWGYTNLTQLQNVTTQYDANNIPLDVQWSDIDWLQLYRDFEYDTQRFKGLPDFLDQLHFENRRYVPILDAGIAYRRNVGYSAFDSGIDQDIFIKMNGEVFIGQVWPGDSAFPDMTHPKAASWWQSNLDSIHSRVAFDGIWADMNEASNFCAGSCYASQKVQNSIARNMKYTPSQRNIEGKSITLDVVHYDGNYELDEHNTYGIREVKAIHEWFAQKNERTFIISRSQFAGFGKWGSTWLGDNFSEERFMGYSVSGIMLNNIFGIQLTGSDVCGFLGDTNPELCARWHVVGSFYPFSRNHNGWGQIPQEPYVFKGQEYEPGKDYMDIMTDAIKQKYALIPYFYTSMTLNSLNGTGTFFKPLFFEFPEDHNTYYNIIYNVMLGQALKVSFNSDTLGKNTTEFYFPQGTWCEINKPDQYPCITSTDGVSMVLPSKAYDSYLHIREGWIAPMHDLTDLKNQNFKTSVDLQNSPISLYVLGSVSQDDPTSWQASGNFFNDNGIVTDLVNNYNLYQFSARYSKNKLQVRFYQAIEALNYLDKTTGSTAVNMNDQLNKIFFYNADNLLNSLDYTVQLTLLTGEVKDVGTATYDSVTKRLMFETDSPIDMTTAQMLVFTPAQ